MNGVKGSLLDAACGYGNHYLEKLDLNDFSTVGIDIDPTVKEKNILHKDFIVCDLHYLRTKCKFSCIISTNTLEHLHSPEIVLHNFYNILFEEGVLIIIAPQRWHYVSVIERLLPNRIKDLAWKILKGKEHMPFPAYYKLCTRRSLTSAAVKLGFQVEYFSSSEGAPLWFTRIPPLFILMCFWMSVVNRYKVLERIRGSFIAVLRKV